MIKLRIITVIEMTHNKHGLRAVELKNVVKFLFDGFDIVPNSLYAFKGI